MIELIKMFAELSAAFVSTTHMPLVAGGFLAVFLWIPIAGLVYMFIYQLPKTFYWESTNSRYGKIVRGILWPFYGRKLIPRPQPSFVIRTHESMIRISGTGRKTLALDEKTFVSVYWSNGKLKVGVSGKASVTRLLRTTVK